MHGMSPYDYFAIKFAKGRFPIHRTDVGLTIIADLIGSRRVLFVKDEDELFTHDPKKDSGRSSFPKSGRRS